MIIIFNEPTTIICNVIRPASKLPLFPKCKIYIVNASNWCSVKIKHFKHYKLNNNWLWGGR